MGFDAVVKGWLVAILSQKRAKFIMQWKENTLVLIKLLDQETNN